MFIAAVCTCPGLAQTITIRLLNAKNGKPMKGKLISLREDFEGPRTLQLDKNGEVRIDLRPHASHVSLTEGPKNLTGDNNVGYYPCNEKEVSVDVETAVRQGYVPGNRCGERKVAPQPGVIIFWGRKKPWWIPYDCRVIRKDGPKNA